MRQWVGQRKRDDPTWKLNPADPRDFDANVEMALDEKLDFEHDGLTEVDSIDDLYHERNRVAVRQYIRTKFELATDGPGFGVDEDPAHLGETLVLPPWLEQQRAAIQSALPPLRSPIVELTVD